MEIDSGRRESVLSVTRPLKQTKLTPCLRLVSYLESNINMERTW